MACLSTLELAVHLAQRLSSWEDGLSLSIGLARSQLVWHGEHTPAPDDIVAVERFCAAFVLQVR